jgi:hypothetical protein
MIRFLQWLLEINSIHNFFYLQIINNYSSEFT